MFLVNTLNMITIYINKDNTRISNGFLRLLIVIRNMMVTEFT